ncbi:hypothetical protein [Geodermatophilus maliterrae]|uniref:Membrane protein YfhO n=1 Tax=Geodermatophilus maliterrae TaxID=3162531 RepID=A0ABV3XC60_9ACTN
MSAGVRDRAPIPAVDGGADASPSRTPAVREGRAALGLFLALEVALLGVLRLWQPRFFYVDDKMAQYLPVWHWLGQRVSWTGVPLVDPDQGSAGALVADLQYGTLDPFHWLLAWVIGRMDGLNLAGWGLHVLAVVVLGGGLVALGTRLGLGAGWAGLAAFGAANSGFLIWYAASWWPAAWGTALLPWLWWGLIGRSAWAAPCAALAAYLLGTSGYPYTLPFAALVVVGVVLEQSLVARDWRAWRVPGLVVRLGAAAGGLLMAAPGLLAAAGMTPYTQRAEATVDARGNAGTFIPNLADVLVGGPTLSSEVSGWWGSILPPAVMATAWFALPLLALVRWSHLRGRLVRGVPGLVTAALLVLASVVATQTPTDVGTLRLPFRYVVVLEVVLPLLVALLVAAAGIDPSRRRVAVAASLILLQGLLALARVPVLAAWHLGVAVVGIGVIAAFGLFVRRSGTQRTGRAALAVLCAATLAAPLASVGASVRLNDVVTTAQGGEATGLPTRGLYDRELWPASVQGFREASLEPGLNASVLIWGSAGVDRGLSLGVPIGSAALFSDVRPGFGYTSLGQAGWAARWCQDYLGQSATCADAVDRLLETVPGTDRTWLEVTAKDVLLLDTRTPPEVFDSLEDRWERIGEQGGFVRYERVDPTEGRVTWTGDGVTDLSALDVGPESESYSVTWSADSDARVLTRTLWWPGYEATLDGRPLEVRAVDRTVIAVDLPAEGGSGELRISFSPPGRTLGLAAVAVGGLVVLGAVGWELVRRRRHASF